MSHTVSWAFNQSIPLASRKFVLVALADYSDVNQTCFPSVKALCEKTGLNRKTVLESLEYLTTNGFIEDTGARVGKTRQVKVLRIKESQKRNGSESGTIPKKEQSRFSSETVPVLPPNGPVFTQKESQKRDTELPSNYPITPTNSKEPSESECWTPKVKREPTDQKVISEFKEQLAEAYRRKNVICWPNSEDVLIGQICQRPDVLSELRELLNFKSQRGRYFPQSIESLLTQWIKTLDQSRQAQYEPGKSKNSIDVEMDNLIKKSERL